MWTLLVPLLGPIAYVRLDLVPAVATIWALERAQARGWFGAGAWLGFGAAAKLYPGLLLGLLLANRWRWRAVAGAVVVGAMAVLPFVGSLDGLWRSVVGYHTERPIQVESSWAALLLLAGHLGHPVQVFDGFGSLNVEASGAELLQKVSLVLSVAGLMAGAWLARKRVAPGSASGLATVMFGTLAVLLATGTVFSPQYMLWLSALGAAAASMNGRRLRIPLVLLAAACALSQVVYPFHYAGLLANHAGPLTALLLRNLFVAAIGVMVFYGLWRSGDHPGRSSSTGDRLREHGGVREIDDEPTGHHPPVRDG